MKPLFHFIILLCLVACIACQPEPPSAPTGTTQRPTSFDNISASNTFDWSTSREVILHFSGFNANFVDQKTVLILSDPNQNTLYKGAHPSGEEINLHIQVPTSLEFINMEYGITKRKLSIGDGTIVSSLLPSLPIVP